MKYLLIDGNNLGIRSAFANDQLTNEYGIPTGAHFGIFQSLINLKKKFHDYNFLIVWDGKSIRRKEESKKGVEEKIIPSAYKENRSKGDDMPQPLIDFYGQLDYIKKAIDVVGIPQIMIDEYEADDVIASYAYWLKKDNEIIIVTSDKDYYQLIDDNVSLWDGMKSNLINKKSLSKNLPVDVPIEPIQMIDVGALSGDDGDNIFGIPGWGDKTALKEISKYKSWEKMIEKYDEDYKEYRKKYPDLKDLISGKIKRNETEFNEFDDSIDWEKVFQSLATKTSDPKKENSRIKYPGISKDMPYTGVLLAFDLDFIKIKKSIIMALVFQDRIKLAYSLKKMDVIEYLPEIPSETKKDKDKLLEYFNYYDINSLNEDIDVFFNMDRYLEEQKYLN